MASYLVTHFRWKDKGWMNHMVVFNGTYGFPCSWLHTSVQYMKDSICVADERNGQRSSLPQSPATLDTWHHLCPGWIHGYHWPLTNADLFSSFDEIDAKYGSLIRIPRHISRQNSTLVGYCWHAQDFEPWIQVHCYWIIHSPHERPNLFLCLLVETLVVRLGHCLSMAGHENIIKRQCPQPIGDFLLDAF